MDSGTAGADKSPAAQNTVGAQNAMCVLILHSAPFFAWSYPPVRTLVVTNSAFLFLAAFRRCTDSASVNCTLLCPLYLCCCVRDLQGSREYGQSRTHHASEQPTSQARMEAAVNLPQLDESRAYPSSGVQAGGGGGVTLTGARRASE